MNRLHRGIVPAAVGCLWFALQSSLGQPVINPIPASEDGADPVSSFGASRSDQPPVHVAQSGTVPFMPLLDGDARKLSFQGRLADGFGDPLTGNHDLHFRIYDIGNGGVPLPDGGPFTVNVDIDVEDNGVVAVLFPDGVGTGLEPTLFDGAARYLGLSIDGEAELAPRLQMTTVPYSMRTDFVGNDELIDDVQLGDGANGGSLAVFDGVTGSTSLDLDGDANLMSVTNDSGNESVRLWGPAWGQLVLRDDNGVTSVEINAATFKTAGGELSLFDNAGFRRFQAGSNTTGGWLQAYDSTSPTAEIGGSDGTVSATGQLQVVPTIGSASVGHLTQTVGGGKIETFDELGNETLSAGSSTDEGGFVLIRQNNGSLGLTLDGDVAGTGPTIVGRNQNGAKRFEVDGSDADTSGRITLYGAFGGPGSGENERIRIDGHGADTASGPRITMWDNFDNQTILLDAQLQTIQLSNQSGVATVGLEADSGGKGRVTAGAITITGGADFSEQFDIDATAGVVPGMVVSIDPQCPGKLSVSASAYDRRVAGIVSGAGGVDPGLLMGQRGTVADGKYPVALTGRVYCRADATTAPIEAGDLLTTSSMLGHAMKVTNHARGQGAIIGKAMTPLREGTGLVLVLVCLQ